MAQFHQLKIKNVRQETSECVSISFDIPIDLKSEFQYKQGQYITIKETLNGEELRRSYSACSSPVVDHDLRIAVKEIENGRMSGFLNNGVKVGQVLEVMKPMGNFYTEMPASTPKVYVGFAAGSGITPILSLLKTALKSDDNSKFTLFYGNKSTSDIIFKSELEELSQEYDGRLRVIHLLSREETVDPLLSGRLSKEKCRELLLKYSPTASADEYFICGPYDMIMGINDELLERGVSKEQIHYELFSTPKSEEDEGDEMDPAQTLGDGKTAIENSKMRVILDEEEVDIPISSNENILDLILDAGLDAPYACTGGSCCTCRAKITEGRAVMDVNYALTDKEVSDGYVLTCQAHPTTPSIVVDFDEP
ncbi:MAG: FAD-binding oxidoreductase [Flavobacteriales bacterium]|nr:FAD-binding oxidoreductase [Flavobacteriales bacterium]